MSVYSHNPTTMPEMITPNQLRKSRKDAGISQSAVAKEANISQPALSQIESGNNDPRLSTVNMIIRAINKLE